MPSCATSGVSWGPSLRSAVFQQTSGIALTSSSSAWLTIKTMEDEERRKRRRRQSQQVVNCCKRLAAFLFSHIGLAAMVVSYSIMGGFLFKAIEAPAEQKEKLKVIASKESKIQEILNTVIEFCELPGGMVRTERNLEAATVESLNNTLRKVFTEFQVEIKDAVKDKGWDGNDDTDESALQWSLAGAILYAVTVITTIGYGHIAPKTDVGRMLTILYALIGIPLTFLYLSNIGNFLADCFRLFYKRICCDIICCQQCERKRKRERLGLRRRREMAARRNILLGIHSEILSHQGLDPEYDDDDDGDDGLKTRMDPTPFRKDLAGTIPGPAGSEIGDENQGYEWESHADNNDDTYGASSSVAETFLSNHPSPSSVRSRRRVERDEEEETEVTSPSSDGEESSETVRETAILEDDYPEANGVRETAILEDTDHTSSSHRSEVRQRDRVVTVDRVRTPSFHVNGFHLLEGAKETDILRDSSVDRESNHFRLSRSKKRAHHYRSDPSLRSTEPELSRCPVSAREHAPVRSLTVKPSLYISKTRHPEYRRQGHSAPGRSDTRRAASLERKATLKVTSGASKRPTKEDAAVAKERAKANWKKLIEYSKKLAEKKQQERLNRQQGKDNPGRKKSERKASRSEDNKSKFLRHSQSMKESETRTKRSMESRDLDVKNVNSPSRLMKPSFHHSEESFVTAISESAASEGGTRGGGGEEVEERFSFNPILATKTLHASLNSVAIDFNLPTDDPDFADFPDFIQDQPINFLDDPFEYEEHVEQEGKVTVPISICLIIISGYLFAGSALFAIWERWDLMTGSYFCFITLSTIGFGDIVPGTDMKEWASEAKLVLCALWLAFGLSLLAMCFNLMQEEVKDKCKWIGQKLGLLKDEGQS